MSTGTAIQTRLYRIESVDHPGPGTRRLRDRMLVRLLRLEDGRVLDVRMRCRRQVGDVLSLDDSQIEMALARA